MKIKQFEEMTLSQQIDHLSKVVRQMYIRLQIAEVKLFQIDKRMGRLLGKMIKE